MRRCCFPQFRHQHLDWQGCNLNHTKSFTSHSSLSLANSGWSSRFCGNLSLNKTSVSPSALSKESFWWHWYLNAFILRGAFSIFDLYYTLYNCPYSKYIYIHHISVTLTLSKAIIASQGAVVRNCVFKLLPRPFSLITSMKISWAPQDFTAKSMTKMGGLSLPWRLKGALLASTHLLSACVHAGPAINVGLQTSFSSAPYLIELLYALPCICFIDHKY